MISQEYSHQVSLARMPNWVAMYAMPPHSTQVVRRSALLLSSSLTYTQGEQQSFSYTAHVSYKTINSVRLKP